MMTLDEIDTKIAEIQSNISLLEEELKAGKLESSDYYKLATSNYEMMTHLNEWRVSKLRELKGIDKKK
jgi:hypothetical protein